jgi:hypothetical protein
MEMFCLQKIKNELRLFLRIPFQGHVAMIWLLMKLSNGREKFLR